jgi:hypothetical protein
VKSLEEFHRLRDGYVKPSQYLGVEVKQWHFLQGTTGPLWALSSSQNINEAIKNL